MRIDNNGNVGINDTTPDARLEILSTSEQLRLTNVDDTTDARFSVSSTGDLTIDMLGSGTTDQLVLGDTDVFSIGGSGSSEVAYNVIGDSTTGASASMNSDDDLYIEGDLEVDGTIFGTVAGTVAWDDLASPDSELTLAHTNFATTFTWDSQDNEDIFTFSYDNNGGTAGTDRFVVITNAVSTQTTGDLNTEALLLLDNADTLASGSTIVDNAILITASGDVVTAITDAIDVSDADIVNALVAGANDLSGTNWSITGSSGAAVFVGVDSGAGLLQGALGLTITGATASLNASSNFAVDIATGTSTGTVTVGGTGVQTIAIGTGAAAKTVTIGSTNTTSPTLIQAGTSELTLEAEGSSAIGRIQIGQGGSGNTTPDFLSLSVKSDTGDPAGGQEGDMYYNTFDNVFRCFQSAGFTDCLDGTGGSSVWSDLTDPTGVLALTFDTGEITTFNATTTGDDNFFTMSLDNDGGTAGTDRVLVLTNAVSTQTTGDLTTEALLLLDQADTTTSGNTAVTDALLITNSGGSTLTNAITIGSGSQVIGTAINIASTGVTTDISLQNGETIDNNVNGTVNIDTTTLLLTNTTTITGSSLTLITGAATAIDFTEFDVSASTGSITIDDGGDAGNISIEGTILDINSLDFVAAGTITSGTNTNLTLTPGGTGDVVITNDSDSILSLTGGADGTAALTIAAGDLTLTDGDLIVTAGDFNVTIDDGDTINFAGDGTPTADVLSINGGTSATDGADNLQLTFGVSNASGNVIDITPSYSDTAAAATSETYNIIDIDAFTATQNASGDTGLIRGLNIGNLTQTETAGTITADAIKIGTGWDSLLDFNGTTVIDATGQIISTQITGTLFSVTGDSGTPETIEQANTLDIAGGTDITTAVGATDTVTVTNSSTLATVTGRGATTTTLVNLNGGFAIAPTTTGTFADFVLETEWTAGDLINADWASATTQTAALTGIDLDFTNLTSVASSTTYGLHINDLAAQTTSTEYAIYQQGTNWDYGLYLEDAAFITGALTQQGDITINKADPSIIFHRHRLLDRRPGRRGWRRRR